eukprot:jgi/Mesvir1/10606/Mv08935-RA.1
MAFFNPALLYGSFDPYSVISAATVDPYAAAISQAQLNRAEPTIYGGYAEGGYKRARDEVGVGSPVGNGKRARHSMDGSNNDPSRYPRRPGEKECTHFLKTGHCRFADTCKFDHPAERAGPMQDTGVLPERPGEPECAYYLKTGQCSYGSSCKYNHPKSWNPAMQSSMDPNGGIPQPLNSKGLPLRRGREPCTYFLREGSCKYGTSCKFDHPERTPANIAAANNVAPQQAMLMAQFQGLPMPLPFAVGHTGGVRGMGGVMPSPYAPKATHFPNAFPPQALPQRPGSADCSFYLRTGQCKYGMLCMFNHPPNASDGVTLSAAGLPRRPGREKCPFYMKTGTCKFGATCRFDHPTPADAIAEAVANSVGAAGMMVPDGAVPAGSQYCVNRANQQRPDIAPSTSTLDCKVPSNPRDRPGARNPASRTMVGVPGPALLPMVKLPNTQGEPSPYEATRPPKGHTPCNASSGFVHFTRPDHSIVPTVIVPCAPFAYLGASKGSDRTSQSVTQPPIRRQALSHLFRSAGTAQHGTYNPPESSQSTGALAVDNLRRTGPKYMTTPKASQDPICAGAHETSAIRTSSDMPNGSA